MRCKVTCIKAHGSVSRSTSRVYCTRLSKLVPCCLQPSISCVRQSDLLFSSYSRSDRKNSLLTSTSLIRLSH